MSCIWKIFSKKEMPKKPTVSKVENPLNRNVSDDILSLQAMEETLLQTLVSLHYKLEEAKVRVRNEFQSGNSSRAKDALARRAVLADREKLLEFRLKKVQEKIKEIRAAK